MTTTTETTKVKFYMEGKEVLAVFPDIKEKDRYRDDLMLCYAHIGQHASCPPEYLKNLRLATPEQYKDLLNELKGQGYENLEVGNFRRPRPSEEVKKQMKNYLVEIEYVSKHGNPLSKMAQVRSTSPEEAMQTLESRIKGIGNCMKINGGNAKLIDD